LWATELICVVFGGVLVPFRYRERPYFTDFFWLRKEKISVAIKRLLFGLAGVSKST
jgi:hypothetical protein